MISPCKFVVVAGLVLGGLAAQAATASAMPMIDAAPAAVAHADGQSGVTQAMWHGGGHWHRYHGWHRGYGWRRHWGWHRHWHHHRHYY